MEEYHNDEDIKHYLNIKCTYFWLPFVHFYRNIHFHLYGLWQFGASDKISSNEPILKVSKPNVNSRYSLSNLYNYKTQICLSRIIKVHSLGNSINVKFKKFPSNYPLSYVLFDEFKNPGETGVLSSKPRYFRKCLSFKDETSH